MVKRALLGAGLGLALLGSGAMATQASGVMAAGRMAVHSNLTALTTADQATDADANAPCAVDASGNQTGNCQDSQNTTGPEDNAGSGSEGDSGQANAAG